MSGSIPVIVNAAGGGAAARGDTLRKDVEAAFAAAGLAIELTLGEGEAMPALIESVAGAPLAVVGGGDGTLGAAAGVFARRGTTLGILPLGTRNHLAKELGLPLDLDGAARLIARGATRRIDLGRIGGADGRAFVNNASIGLYPALVRRREEFPAPKWLAALPAALGALGRLRHHRLRLSLDGDAQTVVTPLLFVGNNRYALNRRSIGTREALDQGILSTYAVASRRRLALVGFALRILAGRADPEADFAAVGEPRRLTVSGHASAIDVAVDGEVVRLALPLTMHSERAALSVIA